MNCLLSVSCYGAAGVSELAEQTNRLLNGLPAEHHLFREQIALTCCLPPARRRHRIGSERVSELGEFDQLPIYISSTIVPVFMKQTIHYLLLLIGILRSGMCWICSRKS